MQDGLLIMNVLKISLYVQNQPHLSSSLNGLGKLR